MNLKNNILRMPNGQKLYFLESKPIDNGKKKIYLVSTTVGTEKNYSLIYVEFVNDNKNVKMWPYEETDSEDLMLELKEKFLENPFEGIDEETSEC